MNDDDEKFQEQIDKLLPNEDKVLKLKRRVPIKCDECDKIVGYLMPSPEMVDRLINFLNYSDVNAFCPKCEESTQEISYN